MNTKLALSTALGAGALLMYLLDPQRGERRRNMLRDQFNRLARQTRLASGKTARDARNRFVGKLYALRSRTRGCASIPDEVLVERIRSKLGSLVRHPRSIHVTVNQGRVTLEGPILSDEIDYMMKRISQLRGVKSIENRLESRDTEAGVPGLQSDYRQPRRGQENPLPINTPTSRFLTGSLGSALAMYGLRNRKMPGIGLAGFGLGLIGLSLLANTRRGRDYFRVPAKIDRGAWSAS